MKVYIVEYAPERDTYDTGQDFRLSIWSTREKAEAALAIASAEKYALAYTITEEEVDPGQVSPQFTLAALPE